MNYPVIYKKLIEKGKQRGYNKKKINGYHELHHIIPKCLGGSNERSNLVMLTAKEHYIAHKLLCEIYPENYHLKIAIERMMSGNDYMNKIRVHPNELDRIKKESSKSKSILGKGRVFKKETCEKISVKAKERWANMTNKSDVVKNISINTKIGMDNDEVRNKCRVNKGSKWYHNPETGEMIHWYVGNEKPPKPFIEGRGSFHNKESKEKLSKVQGNKYTPNKKQIEETFSILSKKDMRSYTKYMERYEKYIDIIVKCKDDNIPFNSLVSKINIQRPMIQKLYIGYLIINGRIKK